MIDKVNIFFLTREVFDLKSISYAL